MYVRHGLNSGAPARSASWRGSLCLALISCLAATGVSAQTGTGTGSGSNTGSNTGTTSGSNSGTGMGSNASAARMSSMNEPSLAQQDQHWGSGGSYGSAYAGSDYSWIPYTHRGYVGISLGNSDYDTPCGPAPLSCDNRDRSVAIYTGGMFNDFLGLEIGARHFGKVNRAGGEARAYGANISLVGMLDMENVNLYLKAGAIYGHTKVTVDPLSGAPFGTATGWGPSATIGVGFNFNRNFNVAIERSRDRFDLAGGGRTYVQSTSLALKYRF